MKSKYHFKFEELTMYQKALEFGDNVNCQIKSFPKEETYRLASQFIRAVDSITLNIAEGSSSSKPNLNRYLQMAWDSAHECVVCSTKAYRRGFLTKETNEKNRELVTELSKMITAYKSYLKKNMNGK
ncbi:four helix bundle protein [Psychroflexus halocasei]|nr:four helix bundle protein [Psychroflexus halocasei]